MRKRTRRIAALGLSMMLIVSNFSFAHAVEPEGTAQAETIVEQPSKQDITIDQPNAAEGDSKADQFILNSDLTSNNKENADDDQMPTQKEEKNQETKKEDTKVTSESVVKVPEMVIPFEEGKVVEIPLEIPEGWSFNAFSSGSELVKRNSFNYDSEKKLLSFKLSYDSQEDMKAGLKDVKLRFNGNNGGWGTSETNTNIKIKLAEDIVMPKVLPQTVVSDGMSDATFKISTGSGDYKLTEITKIEFSLNGGGLVGPGWIGSFYPTVGENQTIVDLENGTVTLRAGYIQWLDSGAIENRKLIDGNELDYMGFPKGYNLFIEGKCANGWEGTIAHVWNSDESSNFVYKKSAQKEEMPSLKEAYQEIDGSKDITFTFNPGSGDYAIKEIKNIQFWMNTNVQEDSYLLFVQSELPVGIKYDLKNGTLTWKRHALTALLYELYPSVGNTYVGGMEVVLANGETRYIKSDGKNAWKIKVLEKSADAVSQEVVTLDKEATQVSKETMSALVEKNKDKDIVIVVPNKNGTGKTVFAFAKNTMKMVDGKEMFDLGIEFITDFTQLKTRSNNFKENEFVFRANFNYDGKLPAPAEISFELDKKWSGQTVYYYQINDNGELSYTGQKAVIGDDGVYTVTQDHCSDYVGLTKAPKGDEENPQKPETDEGKPNDENQAQKPSVKPIKPNTKPTTKPETAEDDKDSAPKTGDVTSVANMLAVMGTGLGSLGVATTMLLKKRKRK